LRVAKVLLEKETIDSAELDAIIEGKEIPPLQPEKDETDSSATAEEVRKEESAPKTPKPGSDMGAAPEAVV
jgi:hypothetical protein